MAVVIVSLVNIYYPPLQSGCPPSDPACLQQLPGSFRRDAHAVHAARQQTGSGAIVLGILLTLASQAFQAVRLVMEERLLDRMELHPMEVRQDISILDHLVLRLPLFNAKLHLPYF